MNKLTIGLCLAAGLAWTLPGQRCHAQTTNPSETGRHTTTRVEVRTRPDRPGTEYETPTLRDLAGFSPTKGPKLSNYGGRTDRKLDATGFFRVQRDGQRWRLVDPEGCVFFSIGLCTVAGDPPDGRALIEKRLGSVDKWTGQTADLLHDCGFNTLGCWSWWEEFRKRPDPLPYTTQWRFMTAFEEKLGGKPFANKPREDPRSLVCLFDPRFESFCDEHARQLTATRDDPWLLGHFSDNELPFQVDLLDEFLKLSSEHSAHKAAKTWLADRIPAGTDMITTQDREAFRQYVVERYYRIVSRAIRKYDPNHLYLGSRFHGRALEHEAVFKACGPYVDVVSINYYHEWTPDTERMNRWSKWSGRPFLITEWYAKGMDSGLNNRAGAGWTVKTQEDRARFYQHFALGLLQNPGCVGWHWFRYQDNGPRREGGTSNKGLVNLEFKPYATLQNAMKELNSQVYPLLDYFQSKNAANGK
jgi:hypothetical protein